MHFFKYQACKNDFIVVEQPLSVEQAIWACERRSGIGADGVLELQAPQTNAHWRMRVINADGSIPEMCGNGFRCAVKHLIDHGKLKENQPLPTELLLNTDAGLLAGSYTKDAQGKVATVTVNLGEPRSAVTKREVAVLGRSFTGYTVSMGNPHFVVGSREPLVDAERFGPALSTSPAFENGCNISFVAYQPDQLGVTAAVYERGAGLTQACGTGAAAMVAVGRELGLLAGTVNSVSLPGGQLMLSVNHKRELLLTGPARFVFAGDFTTWPMSQSPTEALS